MQTSNSNQLRFANNSIPDNVNKPKESLQEGGDAQLTLEDLNGVDDELHQKHNVIPADRKTKTTREINNTTNGFGSYSAQLMPSESAPASAYGQQLSTFDGVVQEKQAALLEDLKSKWDKSQKEHKKELVSLKTTFVSQQEELVGHFQGLMERQEIENKSVI